MNILDMPTEYEGIPPAGWQGMSIPEHTADTLENYLLKGWEPGGFVTACLAGDLFRAVATADVENRKHLWAIVTWIRNYAPETSWGSYGAVDMWTADVGSRRTIWATSKEKEFTWRALKGNE